jgi:hypothetical protein
MAQPDGTIGPFESEASDGANRLLLRGGSLLALDALAPPGPVAKPRWLLPASLLEVR